MAVAFPRGSSGNGTADKAELLVNMVDATSWSGQIPPSMNTFTTTSVQQVQVYGQWLIGADTPGQPILQSNGAIVWQPNRAYDAVTRCGLWPPNISIPHTAGRVYTSGANTLLVPYLNQSGNDVLSINPRLEQQFTYGRMLFGMMLLKSDTTATTATTFSGNFGTAVIPDSRDLLTPGVTGQGALSATALSSQSFPKKDGLMGIRAEQGIVACFGSEILANMQPLVTSGQISAQVRAGPDSIARLKAGKSDRIPVARLGQQPCLSNQSTAPETSLNPYMDFPICDHWWSAWNTSTNYAPYNTYSQAQNNSFKLPDTDLFGVTDYELELYLDNNVWQGWDSWFHTTSENTLTGLFLDPPVESVHLRIEFIDIWCQMAPSGGTAVFKSTNNGMYFIELGRSSRGYVGDNYATIVGAFPTTVKRTLLHMQPEFQVNALNPNASVSTRLNVKHSPVQPDDDSVYVHLGTHIRFSLALTKEPPAYPVAVPAVVGYPLSSTYTVNLPASFMTYSLNAKARDLYQDGRLPLRIIRYDSMGAGQNLTLDGTFVVEVVTGTSLAPYIQNSVQQNSASAAGLDVLYLANLLYNSDSQLFKRFYPGDQYRRIKLDILPGLTFENLRQQPGISENALRVAESAGIFGDIGDFVSSYIPSGSVGNVVQGIVRGVGNAGDFALSAFNPEYAVANEAYNIGRNAYSGDAGGHYKRRRHHYEDESEDE